MVTVERLLFTPLGCGGKKYCTRKVVDREKECVEVDPIESVRLSLLGPEKVGRLTFTSTLGLIVSSPPEFQSEHDFLPVGVNTEQLGSQPGMG